MNVGTGKASLLVLSLVHITGCGETTLTPSTQTDEAAPSDPATASSTQQPAPNLSESPTSVVPTAGVPAAPIQATSVPSQTRNDEVPLSAARTVIDLWNFEKVGIAKPLDQSYFPPQGEDPGGPVLQYYSVVDSVGRIITLEYRYGGGEVRYELDNLPPLGPSYVSFSEGPRSWRGVGGVISIVPQADGRLRIDFTDLQIAERVGAVELPAEPAGSGSIVGDLERYCYEYVEPNIGVALPTDGTGQAPLLERRIDEDWSSEFCAQYQ